MSGSGALGNTTLTIAVFLVFLAATLLVIYRVSHRNATASSYYTAGSSFTGAQNGLAISGDFLSAASFLGISGAIALYGYDGFLYSVGWIVAWLVALFLIAEPLRNVGQYTVGDVLAFRLRARPVRAAAAIATLVICLVYMTAQMAGAGDLVALILGIHSRGGQSLVVVVVGLLMLLYVIVGGMAGTTWVQIIKAVLLMLCVAGLTIYVLGRDSLNLSSVFNQAAAGSPLGTGLLEPGAQYGKNALTRLDFVSLAVSLLLGISCLPHILMRFYTVPNAAQARRSVSWATNTMFVFYICIMVVGFGATALVGPSVIKAAPGAANSAAPLLAFHVGGALLLGIVAAVAFATILAVVAGLTLTAAASFAHDVWGAILARGRSDAGGEVRVARVTALVVGLLAIVGGTIAQGQNVAFLVSLALALAASANLSTLLYSLFWKRFTTTGALWSIYSGLVTSLVLILFSPTVSGSADSIVRGVDFHWFPLTNPGIISIPVSFVCGWVATLAGSEQADPAKFAEMEVRSLTGIGSGLAREPEVGDFVS
jgi:cation/acetate symporter